MRKRNQQTSEKAIAKSANDKRRWQILSGIDPNSIASHLDDYAQDSITIRKSFSRNHDENVKPKVT